MIVAESSDTGAAGSSTPLMAGLIFRTFIYMYVCWCGLFLYYGDAGTGGGPCHRVILVLRYIEGGEVIEAVHGGQLCWIKGVLTKPEVVFCVKLHEMFNMIFNSRLYGVEVFNSTQEVEMNAMFIQITAVPLKQTPMSPRVNVPEIFDHCRN